MVHKSSKNVYDSSKAMIYLFIFLAAVEKDIE